MSGALYSPSEDRAARAEITLFRDWCAGAFNVSLPDHNSFHRWSVSERSTFWSAIWDYCDVRGEKGGVPLADTGDMLADRFFPEARLNYAENLLRKTGPSDALIFRGEDKVHARWSWDHLSKTVSRLQQAFRSLGIEKGDRIAAMLPNVPEAVACMLAAASIGAIWSSCSPDFGEQGIMDRFGQIGPKLFVTCDSYWYNGKLIDVAGKVQAVEPQLGVPIVIVDYCGKAEHLATTLAAGRTFDDFVSNFRPHALEFERLPFSHPLFILFSSGTTGAPKCIVHSVGGTLLQHLKEHRLHCDVRDGDRLFYFTTCGWMMWNWLASGLASGATLCLYDGSPFAPSGRVLWDYAEQEDFSVFGTSAKYLDALAKEGLRPRESHRLDSLRSILSTGSPLSPTGYDYVYRDIKSDVHLASMSGGTDIVSCFVLGNPALPVWSGEIQGPGMGMAVDVFDEAAQPLVSGKGELVCTKAFPSMPIGFWNDPDGARFRAAYFERFPGIWCHGDFAERTEHGGLVIHGRSDATLNPGGVRIGTAEIYNQIELLPEIAGAVCIGQDWDNDVRVVLFVKPAEGVRVDEQLKQRIRLQIRTGASPRHVPAKIIAVSDIPVTKTGKVVELAVRDVVHGRPVKNLEALANPEVLAHFTGIAELSH
ncbi:acetoacetate--CoA ligase [Rhizobium lentis]|uniref:acetoacetate--CoA ligase n=1 Tax=Rhizobium lentis TaxID=1138194 RepID=UPI001C82AB7C|nr:acetoacetate--CoA ligase [Rhizobium lentis]MBX5179016.1 acetoacetate--CoA ligase [Rhizobium lentis]